ncbi:MAG: LapA family protein [Anaerolineae bacterium]
MLISLVLFVILTILAVYFASNNLTIMDVNLLGYPLHATSGVMLVTALGIGFLLGILLMLPAVITRSWSIIRHRRKLQDLQDIMQKKNYGDEKADEH